MTSVICHPWMNALTIDKMKVKILNTSIPIFSPMPSWSLFKSLLKQSFKSSISSHSFSPFTDHYYHLTIIWSDRPFYSLGDSAGKVVGRFLVIPADILAENGMQELISDAIHLFKENRTTINETMIESYEPTDPLLRIWWANDRNGEYSLDSRPLD